MSQPSWAAWIEIYVLAAISLADGRSQPSWAAWIEIAVNVTLYAYAAVAVLLGCVD